MDISLVCLYIYIYIYITDTLPSPEHYPLENNQSQKPNHNEELINSRSINYHSLARELKMQELALHPGDPGATPYHLTTN
jgi:hypothetical protein